jgi:hypothetical protein
VCGEQQSSKQQNRPKHAQHYATPRPPQNTKTKAVESPLLWSDEELVELLEGSPVVPAVRQRLAGMQKEYEALDNVWFAAGSLFNKCGGARAFALRFGFGVVCLAMFACRACCIFFGWVADAAC